MTPTELEDHLVASLQAAALPELADFSIEALGAQVDLEEDELNFSVPSLLIGHVGADFSYPGGDALQLAFAVVVPGADQRHRRQVALAALMAVRTWLTETTSCQPTHLRPARLHPVAVMGLFANYIG